MELSAVLGAVAGVALVLLALYDLFQTVVVPRPSPGRLRIARYVVRGSWRVLRRIADRRMGASRDALLGLFGPASALLLLVVWLTCLILGYGLILYALRDQLAPPPRDLGTSIYFAAVSLTTLGFGEIVAQGGVARIVAIIAAASGLGVVALVVTFLFSLYGSYQRREVQVVALEATAGAPPSAVALLEAYAKLGLVRRLPDVFLTWRDWSAEVLDSHVAYPLLGFFRSSHDNLSWISALGTILDAASLVVTTITNVPRGEAELAKRMGSHLVEDIGNLGFRKGEGLALDRLDFEVAYDRLAHAGYQLEPADVAWAAFEAARATYALRLEEMAAYWGTPAASWLGVHAPFRSPAHLAPEDVVAAQRSAYPRPVEQPDRPGAAAPLR
jgi:hypothetical protein